MQDSLKTLVGFKTKKNTILQTIPALAHYRMAFGISLNFREVFKEMQESLKTLGGQKNKQNKHLQTIPA